jgi:hypothetical protein
MKRAGRMIERKGMCMYISLLCNGYVQGQYSIRKLHSRARQLFLEQPRGRRQFTHTCSQQKRLQRKRCGQAAAANTGGTGSEIEIEK